jgi:hypothetical protein
MSLLLLFRPSSPAAASGTPSLGYATVVAMSFYDDWIEVPHYLDEVELPYYDDTIRVDVPPHVLPLSPFDDPLVPL